MTETGAWQDRQMYDTDALARFLGGSEDSFTGLLLVLMQKADPGNLARIRNAISPAPTPRQLREVLQGDLQA